MHRLHQTGSVGAGSDHLQLIKFWRSCTPGKGGLQRGKIWALPYYSHCRLCGSMGGLWWGEIFRSALLRRARSVCVSLSTFSFCCDFILVYICNCHPTLLVCECAFVTYNKDYLLTYFNKDQSINQSLNYQPTQLSTHGQ